MTAPAQPRICDMCGKVVLVRVPVYRDNAIEPRYLCYDCFDLWLATQQDKKARKE